MRASTEGMQDLINALRPFAKVADSMWALNNNVEVHDGVRVGDYREAFRLVREYELKERGHA